MSIQYSPAEARAIQEFYIATDKPERTLEIHLRILENQVNRLQEGYPLATADWQNLLSIRESLHTLMCAVQPETSMKIGHQVAPIDELFSKATREAKGRLPWANLFEVDLWANRVPLRFTDPEDPQFEKFLQRGGFI